MKNFDDGIDGSSCIHHYNDYGCTIPHSVARQSAASRSLLGNQDVRFLWNMASNHVFEANDVSSRAFATKKQQATNVLLYRVVDMIRVLND